MHQENCQLKSTLLVYSTDGIVYVGCIFKIFATPKAEDCTPQQCKTYFCSYKVYCVRVWFIPFLAEFLC